MYFEVPLHKRLPWFLYVESWLLRGPVWGSGPGVTLGGIALWGSQPPQQTKPPGRSTRAPSTGCLMAYALVPPRI